MDTSSISSLSNSLASFASNSANANISEQIAVAVMKQIQRQQEVQTQGLLSMMANTPSLTGTGSILDRYA